jgi:hypothetical protein
VKDIMKKTNCLFVMSAIVILLASSIHFTVSTAAEQSVSSPFTGYSADSDFAQWLKNPKDWVNPVERKIQEFKVADFSNEDIIKELVALGYGWDPESNAMWKGTRLSAEEQSKMTPSVPAQKSGQEMLDDYYDLKAVQRSNGYDWYGVAAEVNAGSMEFQADYTEFSYLTVQLGDLDGVSNWIEMVLRRDGQTYRHYYIYDNDEGGWYLIGAKAYDYLDTYVVMENGNWDSPYGYEVDCWLNYEWAGTFHITGDDVQGGYQKEVFSSTGDYCDESEADYWFRQWLMGNYQYWEYWDTGIATNWWDDGYPMSTYHEFHLSTCYYWQTQINY